MVDALAGGAAVALAVLIIAVLKRKADRGTKPAFMASEFVESLIAVGFVTLFALGAALVIASIESGWLAPMSGAAVAVAGLVFSVAVGRRGATPKQ